MVADVEEQQQEAQKGDGQGAVVKKNQETSNGISGAEKAQPKEGETTTTKQSKTEVDDDGPKMSESDATLILLSAEEEAEISAQTNEDAVKVHSSSSSAKKGARDPQKNVWVSNIARRTKAADLKKLFSSKFKVETAKIVTNGTNFFGYICLETAEMAQKSIRELNGTMLNERKLSITLSRPDVRSTRGSGAVASAKRTTTTSTNRDSKKDDSSSSRSSTKKGSEDGQKKSSTTTNGGGDKKTKEDAAKDGKEAANGGGSGSGGAGSNKSSKEKKKEDPQEELVRLRQRDQRATRRIQELKTDLNRITTELQNNRRRLTEANRRLDAERERKTALRKELDHLETQLKAERRRFTQEMEQVEKKRKVDDVRYQEDRAALNRELDECRKLREFLQRKIGDFGMERARSPPRHSAVSRSRGHSSDKSSRPRMHPPSSRGRSPPPPPKILGTSGSGSGRRSRERSPAHSYKSSKKPRIEEYSSSGHYHHHHHQESMPYPSAPKPLLGHYPHSGQSTVTNPYGSSAYAEPHRYGSSSAFSSSSYALGTPAPLMSRSLNYSDVRGSSNQRKY